jgi:hypothetical protein
VVTVGGEDTSVLITDLHPYEYYQFTVFASTRIGSSPVSTVAIRTEEASEYIIIVHVVLVSFPDLIPSISVLRTSRVIL